MNLIFRRMTGDDIDCVYKIERQLFSCPWTKKSFVFEVHNAKYSYPFIAEEEFKIVGYIIAWYIARELHIGNVAVVPERQGQGIGKFLLSNLFALLNDYEISYLEVRENNIRAIKMYESFGFSPLYKRRAYYPDGEDAVIMIKSPQKGKSDGLV